ncbi:hypothetical protein [Clostridium massiliamazoniense]|uniref:hypothetical protein n=1 Tax=Clostridium massiliamazoniense TaxID=1347366 RepID=UPI0006D7D4ED|nr:hypothetical protein [Clostridium massiliamazoniense]
MIVGYHQLVALAEKTKYTDPNKGNDYKVYNSHSSNNARALYDTDEIFIERNESYFRTII